MRKRTNRVSADEREDLLCSPAADEFAKALGYCGWMIVLKPQYVGDRWRLNRPSGSVKKSRGLPGARRLLTAARERIVTWAGSTASVRGRVR